MSPRFCDFTKMSVGKKTAVGAIHKCTYCGRAGLRERVGGKEFFTHSITSQVDKEGHRHLKWDLCPKAEAVSQPDN